MQKVASIAETDNLISKIRRIQELMILRATGKLFDYDEESNQEYITLRTYLIRSAQIKKDLPADLIECSDLHIFWSKIKNLYTGYEQRRQHIYEAFRNLLHNIEFSQHFPMDDVVSSSIQDFSVDDIFPVWEKALERRNTDPEGAITLARSIIELTCKKILEDMEVHYIENDDLPSLYRNVAKQLKLSPNDHSETTFKQILGACQNIVTNLASLRNKHGDAHGQTKTYRPSPRHAELAVNLAGTMVMFLIETWKIHNIKEQS